jgi:PAS domain S-box-containing protein
MRLCPICAGSFGDERICPEHRLPLVEPAIKLPSRDDQPLSGKVFDGRYLIGRLAGKGGMGSVFEAENIRIGRRVAVKVLHPEMQADPKMKMRLFREMQATSRISHPNVVQIFDYGEDDDFGAYLVMEFLEGAGLSTVLRKKGRLEVELVMQIAVKLSSALAATHAHGLIHRDLKPSNIRLLPDGKVKVLDFGLVKAFERSHADEFATITTGGIAFGTPWYMSPEQASFQPLDQRSDIYSLGIVLYELMVGRPPFMAKNPLDLIEAQRHTPPPLPSQLDSPVDLPAPVVFMLLKMLNKSADDRHQSASELSDHLYRVADELGIDLDDAEANVRRTQEAPRVPADPEEGKPTEAMTAPFWPPARNVTHDVANLARQRFDKLVDQTLAELRATIPRYRALPQDALEMHVRLMMQAGIQALDGKLEETLPTPVLKLAEDRAEAQFTITELLGAVLISVQVCRPLLRPQNDDLNEFLEIQADVDRRIIPFYLRIVDHYFQTFNRRLIRLNDMLSRRNEELQTLRGQLSRKLRTTTVQLAEAERLKARVAENISSGLLLVERGTHKVLMFNKAMERLSGLSPAEVLQRPVDEVLPFVDGVPAEEFIEQLRLHGEVGLRKLRVGLPNGSQRSVYIRGQVLADSDNRQPATLFVIDDVTERERIIESFSRYVSRDVVDRVLRMGGDIKPSGDRKEVVLMACGIRDFRAILDSLNPALVTETLTDYIRCVGDAVFHRGGTIDSVVGDAMLLHFPNPRRGSKPALEAAIDICDRLEKVSDAREKRELPPLAAGIGMHVGEVMVLNVGSEKHMVQTVIGEAAVVAEHLQDVASGGEVLVSSQFRELLGEDIEVEDGPRVALPDRPMVVEAFRAYPIGTDEKEKKEEGPETGQ